MNLVLDEFVGTTEKLSSDDDDRGGAITDFLVLLLGEFDEDLCGGVFDFEKLENGSTVI